MRQVGVLQGPAIVGVYQVDVLRLHRLRATDAPDDTAVPAQLHRLHALVVLGQRDGDLIGRHRPSFASQPRVARQTHVVLRVSHAGGVRFAFYGAAAGLVRGHANVR